jgi:hypothetical protein
MDILPLSSDTILIFAHQNEKPPTIGQAFLIAAGEQKTQCDGGKYIVIYNTPQFRTSYIP